MAVILGNHGFHIFPPVGLKAAGIIELRFGAVPHIPGLVHDVQAQLIAGIQQTAAHGVVGRADGIEAEGFHFLHPAVFTDIIAPGTEDAVIVVDAAAAELDGLPVDKETVAIPLQCADAETNLRAVAAQTGTAGVEIGVLVIPELCIRNFHGHIVTLSGSHHSLSIQDGNADLSAGMSSLHPDHGWGVGQGADPDALRENVGFVTGEQPHRAIDACTGVPAGIGRFRIVHGHMDGMGSAVCQMGAIHKAVAVAIVGKGGFLTVQKDFARGIDALKQQHSAAALREREFLFVFIASASEVGRAGAAGVFLLPLLQQHGIVGHGNRPQYFPRASKTPGFGEICFFHGKPPVSVCFPSKVGGDDFAVIVPIHPGANYRKTEGNYRIPDFT